MSSRGRAGPYAVRVLASVGKEAQGPSNDHPPPPAATSWYEEFRRLYDTVPCVEVQTLREHADQVLHLSFSHSGYQFASCSKDCTIKVGEHSWGSWGQAVQLGSGHHKTEAGGRGATLTANGAKWAVQSQEPRCVGPHPSLHGQPVARISVLVVVSGYQLSWTGGLQHGPWYQEVPR